MHSKAGALERDTRQTRSKAPADTRSEAPADTRSGATASERTTWMAPAIRPT